MEENTTNYEINEQILDRLDSLNQNTVATNNSIKELQEYLIIQEKKRQEKEEEEKQVQEENEKQSEESQKLEKENEQTAQAEQSARADAQNETYETLLMDIRQEQQLMNQLLSGQFMFFGIICGILLFKILWDKLT